MAYFLNALKYFIDYPKVLSDYRARMTATSIPDPEIRPATDESPVVIGPNLAENQELAKAVTQYLTQEYWYPQLWLAQPFWNTWRQVDNMWRARFAARDLAMPNVTKQSVETKTPTHVDGKSARGQSVKPFQQMHAVTNIMEQISWEDGLPVRAEVPEDVIEGDFYRPSEQSCLAANTILRTSAEEMDLRTRYRRNAGCFAKYGCSWALTDFEMRYEDVTLRWMAESPEQAQAIIQAYPSAQMVAPGMLVARERRVSSMVTHFIPLSVDDVLIDPLVSLSPVDRQPCPIVRQHITAAELQAHRYDAELNPFGWQNVDMAITETQNHYALSQEDEGPLRDRLKNRYNISDQTGGGWRTQRIKQLWRAFPLLRIAPDGTLDTSNTGVECPHCEGKGKFTQRTDSGQFAPSVTCPTCQGSGRVYLPLKRYFVDFFGGMGTGAVCLRIQEMPQGYEIPLLFAADLVEDDSTSIPMSKAEVALIATEQLTTCETQFEDSKNKVIYRGTKVKEDSPAAKVQDFNKPNLKVTYESDPREVERFDAGQYDETVTLLPQIQRKEDQIEQIFGVTPTLQGLLASGRRSALEIGEATEAAKNPLVLMTDRFNRQMMGGWGRKSLRNLELFGDRDYIRRVTGREYFGKVRMFTAVGKEFFAKLAAQQNIRYILESSANDPAMQAARPALWNKLLPLMGITDVRVPDGGMQKAQDEAMQIVSRILGDGEMLPPSPEDPHEIFLQVFNGALKDPYWQKHAPQNLPLLQQRIMWQTQLNIQQQMLMLQQQAAEQRLLNPPQEEQPGKQREPAKDAGQLSQSVQG